MAAELDEQVASFRKRPLGDAGPFTFVAADALTLTDPRRWACGQRGGPDRYRGQRCWTSRGLRTAGSHHRELGGLERAACRPGGPGTYGGTACHL